MTKIRDYQKITDFGDHLSIFIWQAKTIFLIFKH